MGELWGEVWWMSSAGESGEASIDADLRDGLDAGDALTAGEGSDENRREA